MGVAVWLKSSGLARTKRELNTLSPRVTHARRRDVSWTCLVLLLVQPSLNFKRGTSVIFVVNNVYYVPLMFSSLII